MPAARAMPLNGADCAMPAARAMPLNGAASVDIVGGCAGCAPLSAALPAGFLQSLPTLRI